MRLFNRFARGGVLAAAVLMAASTQAEDLIHIYNKAAENDHQFRAAEAAYEAGLEAKGLGRAGILPRFNGVAEWTDSSTDASGEAVPAQGLPYEADSTNSGWALSLEQPLFDLGAWNSFKAGAASATVAEAQFRAEQQALILRTAQAYFDVLQAASNLETSLSEEEALSHQLEQIQQRFEVGLSAITEVHEAQASYDSAHADRLINQGLLAVNFEALEVLTGENYSVLAPLKDEFVVEPPQPAEREEWVALAQENNHNLAAADANSESARYSAKSAKAGHYPRLTFNGSYSSYNDDTDISEFRYSDIDNDTQMIGVTLSVPIYNGGGVSASRRQAQQLAIQARELYLQSKRNVVQAARSEYLTVTTSVATVKARAQAIISTESALEATKAGYSVGTRNLVDVLNAQRSLYQAKRDYDAALYAYIMSTLRLKDVAGILTADDLVQLNAWLDQNSPVYKDASNLTNL